MMLLLLLLLLLLMVLMMMLVLMLMLRTMMICADAGPWKERRKIAGDDARVGGERPLSNGGPR